MSSLACLHGWVAAMLALGGIRDWDAIFRIRRLQPDLAAESVFSEKS